MAFRLLPREDEYFSLFAQMTEKIQEGAAALDEMMKGAPADFETAARKIKYAEHGCDELTHSVTTKLNKSFITPFDREDIFALSVALDDVLDYIDAAARAILMYDINEITDHARHFSRIMVDLAKELHMAVSQLDKPSNMNQHIVEIHRLENEADDLYFRSIGELFRDQKDTITVIKYKQLYEIMENATDRCESVANIIESIFIKHN